MRDLFSQCTYVRISTRLWMRDLFSQCTCVRTYIRVCHTQECQFVLMCTQRSGTQYITCTDTGEYRMLRLSLRYWWRTGKNGASWQWRTGDNAVGLLQRTHFAESSTERSRRFVALRKRKQWSQGTVEAKSPRREQQKVRKKKARCGESSQARYKLCSIFMFDSTVVLSSMAYPHAQCAHTHWHGTARGIMRMHSPSLGMECFVLCWHSMCNNYHTRRAALSYVGVITTKLALRERWWQCRYWADLQGS